MNANWTISDAITVAGDVELVLIAGDEASTITAEGVSEDDVTVYVKGQNPENTADRRLVPR